MRAVRHLLLVVACAPLAILATLVLVPFWSWVERRHGIEAIGHSGPAEWCYVATYVALVTFVALVALLRRRRPIPPASR